MRVGIPQGLLYFKYGELWKKCLNAMGAEVVVSPETTTGILDDGIKHSVCDLCLPVKAFFGHVLALKDNVDYLFIPRVIRVEPDAYLCPKFLGLPDMVRAAIRNLPPVIDTEFNVKEKSSAAFWADVMRELKITKKIQLPDIIDTNVSEKSDYQFNGLSSTLPCPAPDSRKLTVGVAGRQYLIMDDHLNKGVIRYMNSAECGINVVCYTPDKNYISDTMEKLPRWIYWSMGKEVASSARWMLEDNRIDGIVLLSTAACGPDSFVAELIERTFAVKGKPYMSLKIDEHSSDVGIKTRVEAFVDMIARNCRAGAEIK